MTRIRLARTAVNLNTTEPPTGGKTSCMSGSGLRNGFRSQGRPGHGHLQARRERIHSPGLFHDRIDGKLATILSADETGAMAALPIEAVSLRINKEIKNVLQMSVCQ